MQDLHFRRITVRGFWLNQWLESLPDDNARHAALGQVSLTCCHAVAACRPTRSCTVPLELRPWHAVTLLLATQQTVVLALMCHTFDRLSPAAELLLLAQHPLKRTDTQQAPAVTWQRAAWLQAISSSYFRAALPMGLMQVMRYMADGTIRPPKPGELFAVYALLLRSGDVSCQAASVPPRL